MYNIIDVIKISLFALFFTFLLSILLPQYLSAIWKFIKSGEVHYNGGSYLKSRAPVKFYLMLSLQISYISLCIISCIFTNGAALDLIVNYFRSRQ